MLSLWGVTGLDTVPSPSQPATALPGPQVLASFGHVRDLPPKTGSVAPEAGFAMSWQLSARGAERMRDIEDATRRCARLVGGACGRLHWGAAPGWWVVHWWACNCMPALVGLHWGAVLGWWVVHAGACIQGTCIRAAPHLPAPPVVPPPPARPPNVPPCPSPAVLPGAGHRP